MYRVHIYFATFRFNIAKLVAFKRLKINCTFISLLVFARGFVRLLTNTCSEQRQFTGFFWVKCFHLMINQPSTALTSFFTHLNIIIFKNDGPLQKWTAWRLTLLDQVPWNTSDRNTHCFYTSCFSVSTISTCEIDIISM